jgi:hypothetical protein
VSDLDAAAPMIENWCLAAVVCHVASREALNSLADAVMPLYTLLAIIAISTTVHREQQANKDAARNAAERAAYASAAASTAAATRAAAAAAKATSIAAAAGPDGGGARQADAASAPAAAPRPNFSGHWKLARNENYQEFLAVQVWVWGARARAPGRRACRRARDRCPTGFQCDSDGSPHDATVGW